MKARVPPRASTLSLAQGGTALECHAASVLQEPDIMKIWGLVLASAFGLCRVMPRSCISAKAFRQIATPVTACNFQLPRFQPHRLVAECIATMACISWNKEAIFPRSDRMLPLVGQTPLSLPFRALSDTLSPRYARHPLHDAAS